MKILRYVISAAFAALVATGLSTETAAAQTVVQADSARAFIGDWNVDVAAEPPVTIKVIISDNDGHLAAEVTGMEGTVTTVKDISREQGALVLKYVTSIQGQSLPIKITLAPETDTGKLTAALDLADGLATFPGTVSPAEGQ